MITTKAIGRITNKIADAEKLVIRGFHEKAIETEPSFTDRLLGAIEMAFGENGFESDGYRIRVRTLRDRGKGAPEHEFGADFVSVLDINIPNYSLSKGFLVQAKIAGKEEFQISGQGNYPLQIRLPEKEKSRLTIQCEQMLSISPDSYIFVYSQNGIYVVPATTAVNIVSDGTPRKIYAKTLKQFYKDHMMSFIGDRKIDAYDDETLRSRRDIVFANSGMLIQIRNENPPKEKPSMFSFIELD